MIVLLYLTALVVSFFTCYLIIKFTSNTLHICNDPIACEPQKFHKTPVPRIGGVGIVAGFVTASVLTAVIARFSYLQIEIFEQLALLIVSALPAFFSGLFEDITKNGSVKFRLLCIGISALLAICLLKIAVSSIGVVFLDPIMAIPIVSVAFTVFAMVGVTNAFNIIDGLNGLASGSAIIVTLAIAYISYVTGQYFEQITALIVVFTVMGFLRWNFPKGRIFLGDGGAYFIGFVISVLIINLGQKNPEISPWFALMVVLYPVTETLFSIYRRKVIRKKSVGKPDAIHLHTLIYRRLVRCMSGAKDTYHVSHRNSQSAPFLWGMTLLSAIPAVIFRQNSIMLITFVVIFVCFYIWLYRSIVRFKTPKILNLRYWRAKKAKQVYKVQAQKIPTTRSNTVP